MIRVVALSRSGGELRRAAGLGALTAIATAPVDDPVFARARAAGAARLVAIAGHGLSDTDYLGTAQVLASATRKLGFDLVVCGDGVRGVVGPAVAERLGVPHLSGVVDARIDGTRAIVRRREGGKLRTYAAELPVVLCMSSPAPSSVTDEPERTSETQGPAIESLSLSEIGVLPAELGWRRRFAPRPTRGPAARPRVFPDSAALARRLADEGLVAPPARVAPTGAVPEANLALLDTVPMAGPAASIPATAVAPAEPPAPPESAPSRAPARDDGG